jgi:hypothetical protein
MTSIEKAIRTVSDMREFYRRIPKIADGASASRPKPAPSRTAVNPRPNPVPIRQTRC